LGLEHTHAKGIFSPEEGMSDSLMSNMSASSPTCLLQWPTF
jgi:hypothetical protein